MGTVVMLSTFPLGELVITVGALDHLTGTGTAPIDLLTRHAAHDWGDLDPEDARMNAIALRTGARLLSSYDVAGEKVWIITEADRALTTVLLAREY